MPQVPFLMSKLSFSFLIVFLFFQGLHAQISNSGDCRTVIPVCADAPILSQAEGSGDIDDFDPDTITQIGCLEKGSNSSANIENNTSWFVFRAGTDGQVGFDIQALPSISNTSPTAEWDFAVFGPDVNCTEISSGAIEPIRCNYEVNGTDYTGIGVNPENGEVGEPFVVGSKNTYDEWLDVQAGEIYYILINNYNLNTEPDPFMLTFTGSSVQADQNTALDCTLRDEFLGLDIIACVNDPDILLSALSSPAGSDINGVVQWSVDTDDDGTPDSNLTGTGLFEGELTVSSPNSGRYFATIFANTGEQYTDDILISFFDSPVVSANDIDIFETNLSETPDQNNIEIVVNGNSSYEYAINGGEFQDDPIFRDIPPGLNTLIVNDKNGCGTTQPIEFLVVGYPKFFTPNGDGRHDVWSIQGVETLDNPVTTIFDRYGKLIAQLSNNATWDGTYNGTRMPSSDYWFKFEYGETENAVLVTKTRQAHFSLKR